MGQSEEIEKIAAPQAPQEKMRGHGKSAAPQAPPERKYTKAEGSGKVEQYMLCAHSSVFGLALVGLNCARPHQTQPSQPDLRPHYTTQPQPSPEPTIHHLTIPPAFQPYCN
eukprot:gene11231-biopygen22871